MKSGPRQYHERNQLSADKKGIVERKVEGCETEPTP